RPRPARPTTTPGAPEKVGSARGCDADAARLGRAARPFRERASAWRRPRPANSARRRPARRQRVPPGGVVVERALPLEHLVPARAQRPRALAALAHAPQEGVEQPAEARLVGGAIVDAERAQGA